MARFVNAAATSRQCPPVKAGAGTSDIDGAVLHTLQQVWQEVKVYKPDLLLFPEMWDCPKEMPIESYIRYIKKRNTCVMKAVSQLAQNANLWVCFGTLRTMPQGKIRNCSVLINPQGQEVCVYDKLFLTQGEISAGLEPGDPPVVYDCELGRLGFAICFDLNYPALAMEYHKKGIDLLLFSSLFHGGIMQRSWAFTTQSYFLSACGGCGAGILNPVGETCAETTVYYPEIVKRINLDYTLVHLDFNKEKIKKAAEKYGEALCIYNPANFPAVLVECASHEFSAAQVVEKMGMEPLKEYLQRLARENDKIRIG